MYQFNKHKDEDGVWRFELGAISLLIDGFFIEDEKHHIKNPLKAIGFFNLNGHIYGVSNNLKDINTAEDFYDIMLQQYCIIRNGKKQTTNNSRKNPGSDPSPSYA